MMTLFLKGGPIMYPLLLCSIVGLFICIQKLLYLNHQSQKNDAFIEQIKERLLQYGKSYTLKELRSHRKVLLKILAQTIKLSHLPKEDIKDGVKEVSYIELPKLDQHMSLLSSIITTAPILGLFGTVLGLVDIFNVISGGQIGDMTALSSGISQALLTTVTGIGIAIPLIFIQQHISQKIERLIMQTERSMYEMIHFCQQSNIQA